MSVRLTAVERLRADGITAKDFSEALQKTLKAMDDETPKTVADAVVQVKDKQYRIGDVATVTWESKTAGN